MNGLDLSVIISIYNAEKDLHIMLDSLKAQSIQSVEYILIDNGSKDSTRQICESYAKSDRRFRVEVIEENIGYIRARNYGLTLCNGKYITFADADDFLNDNAYELMLNEAKKSNADWVLAPYYMVYPDGTKKLISLNVEKGVYTGEKLIEQIIPISFGYNTENVILKGFMWRMLFKSELVKLLDNKFFEEAKPREDELFNQRIACASKRVCVVDFPVYHYRINEESVTAKLQKNFNLESDCKNIKFHFEKSLMNAKEGKVEQLVECSVFLNLFSNIYALCLNCAKFKKFNQLENASNIILQYFSKDLLEKMGDCRKNSKMSLIEKVTEKCLKGGRVLALLYIIKFSLKLKGRI